MTEKSHPTNEVLKKANESSSKTLKAAEIVYLLECSFLQNTEGH